MSFGIFPEIYVLTIRPFAEEQSQTLACQIEPVDLCCKPGLFYVRNSGHPSVYGSGKASGS